jgi:hypothetical protein
MTRLPSVISCTLLGLGLARCSEPSASGTKTNWFIECDVDAECGDEAICICGLCTQFCADDTGCPVGRCSTALESSIQCVSTELARICLPQTETECIQVAVESDPDLGEPLSPGCDIDGALVCEAFDGPLPTEYSTSLEDEMSAFIQDCEVARGTGALHYASEAPGQSQTRILLSEEVASGPLHARFFVRIGGQMVLPEQLQLLEFWDRGGTSGPERISVFVSSDGNPRVYVGSSNTTLEPSPSTPLPRDTWVCLEVILDIQDLNGGAALLIDESPLVSGSGFDSQPTEPIGIVVIEGQPTTDTEGVDVYLDDLVVASDPIGCQ